MLNSPGVCKMVNIFNKLQSSNSMERIPTVHSLIFNSANNLLAGVSFAKPLLFSNSLTHALF